MVVAFDRNGLEARLNRVSQLGVVAFMAGCVQRRRSAVQVLVNHGRDADVDAFDSVLDDLWAVVAGELDVSSRSWDGLDGFDELESDEEAEGALAYSEDAIVALWYATQFMRKGGREFALHCASRCYDSAGFLDDAVGGDFEFADTEARIQLEDLAEIESISTGRRLATALKQRADLESVRVASQLRR
jgi:hypothetical protein